MTAVLDLANDTVHARIEIEAPPEAVFEALTQPVDLAAWWGSPEMYQTSGWKLDLRKGGAWSCNAKSATGERESTVRGEYTVVDPPKTLEFTWCASWEGFARSVVRIDLERSPSGGTKLCVTHSQFESADKRESAKSHGDGWVRVLGWLEKFLQPQ